MIAIGLMSGTSLDGVDAILVEISNGKYNPIKFVTLPYEESFKKRILKNLSDASAKLSEISSLNYELGDKFVDAIDLLLKDTVVDFIPENNRSNPLQSHILNRLANLLVNNRLIFTWTCTNIKTNTEVNGIVFHDVTLQKPNESLKFLKSLLKNTCTVSTSITKLNDTTNVIALEFVLKRRSLTELKNIVSYDIFVKNEDPEIKWYGLLSTNIENTHCKKGDKTDVIKLNFSCLCTKKGRFNINRIGIAFHKKDNKDIVLYNPPEQIMVDIK